MDIETSHLRGLTSCNYAKALDAGLQYRDTTEGALSHPKYAYGNQQLTCGSNLLSHPPLSPVSFP